MEMKEKNSNSMYERFVSRLVLIKLKSGFTHIGVITEICDDALLLEDNKGRMCIMIKKEEVMKIELDLKRAEAQDGRY